MIRIRPPSVKTLMMPVVSPVTAIHTLLIQPELGPASRIHPTAAR